MKDLLFKNWDIVRVFRMLIGLLTGAYAVWSDEYFLLILAGLFIVQALFQLSCCGTGCTASASDRRNLYKDTIKPYEPVKSKKNSL